MSPQEKLTRLALIGKNAKLLNERYGYSENATLRETLKEIKAALIDRVIEILEA